MGDIDVAALSAIALNIKILTPGGMVASHLSGVPQFAFCDFVAEETDTFKSQRTFQNKLLPQLAKVHGIGELSIRNRTVDEILSKGKVTVVCPVADDGIVTLIRNGKIFQKIRLGLEGKTGRNIKFPNSAKERSASAEW